MGMLELVVRSRLGRDGINHASSSLVTHTKKMNMKKIDRVHNYVFYSYILHIIFYNLWLQYWNQLYFKKATFCIDLLVLRERKEIFYTKRKEKKIII